VAAGTGETLPGLSGCGARGKALPYNR